MIPLIIFTIGFFLGGFIGMIAMSCLAMARDER